MANVGHELRTPLNPIIGLADLMSELNPDPEQQDYLRNIKTSAIRLLNLVNDLIEISRLEAGSRDEAVQPFPVKSVLDSLITGLNPEASRKGLEITSHIDASVPELVHGNPAVLKRVLTKIGENAVKFTEQGSVTISLDAEMKDDELIWLHFSIADTGIGIPAEHLSRLFEDFTQADGSSTRVYGGLGLGLTLVRRLVQIKGGRIWAESQEGKGSTFNVMLPFEVSE